jgi:hypothetical protein
MARGQYAGGWRSGSSPPILVGVAASEVVCVALKLRVRIEMIGPLVISAAKIPILEVVMRRPAMDPQRLMPQMLMARVTRKNGCRKCGRKKCHHVSALATAI